MAEALIRQRVEDCAKALRAKNLSAPCACPSSPPPGRRKVVG
jgi:hypothetical protein